jgi:hypothetical protein
MINGAEKLTTIEMLAERGSLTYRDVMGILNKFWDPRVADNVRNVKETLDGSSVVFDIWSDKFEAFMDNYERLKQTQGHKVDFSVRKCTKLPELYEDDDGFGGGTMSWRD